MNGEKLKKYIKKLKEANDEIIEQDVKKISKVYKAKASNHSLTCWKIVNINLLK